MVEIAKRGKAGGKDNGKVVRPIFYDQVKKKKLNRSISVSALITDRPKESSDGRK